MSAGDYAWNDTGREREGLFARIERGVHKATGEVHWRSVSKTI